MNTMDGHWALIVGLDVPSHLLSRNIYLWSCKPCTYNIKRVNKHFVRNGIGKHFRVSQTLKVHCFTMRIWMTFWGSLMTKVVFTWGFTLTMWGLTARRICIRTYSFALTPQVAISLLSIPSSRLCCVAEYCYVENLLFV